jgi:hypothetical protein
LWKQVFGTAPQSPFLTPPNPRFLNAAIRAVVAPERIATVVPLAIHRHTVVCCFKASCFKAPRGCPMINIPNPVRWILFLPAAILSILICQIPIYMLTEALDYTPFIGPLVAPWVVWFMHCAMPPFSFVVVGTLVSPAERPGIVALLLALVYSLCFVGSMIYLRQWGTEKLLGLAIVLLFSFAAFWQVGAAVDEHNREAEREY